jgi:putative transposase
MPNHVKCRDTDSIDFLIASTKIFSCTEATKVQPESLDPPAHDAFARLLHRLEPDPEALWREARPLVHRMGGLLVLDDSTLNKPYANARLHNS